jgi:hypothetical protein
MLLLISAEQLNWESERKIQQLEQNWQLQMSSTRATLELVKEQMERDAQDRLEAAEEKHRKQLGAHKYSSLECYMTPSLLHWGTFAAGFVCMCGLG